MHGGTVGTDPVAGQSQRGRRRGQPAAAVPILQVGEQQWHRCRAMLGRLAALRQQGRLSAGGACPRLEYFRMDDYHTGADALTPLGHLLVNRNGRIRFP